MISTGQFSEGTKRLLQRNPALPAVATRDLASAFNQAQVEVCGRLAALALPLERIVQELQAGHLPYFREGSDRDRKRESARKASYRFAGFAPSHVEEFVRRRAAVASGMMTPVEFTAWASSFLFGFTFEVIEQVARRALGGSPGRSIDAALAQGLDKARALRDEILTGNLLLAAKVVVSRARFCPEAAWDDLFAAGTDGLMIAINRYDPTVGNFSTYAVPWVKMAIDRFVAKTRHVIRIPIGMQDKVRRKRAEGGAGPALPLIPEVQSLEEPVAGFADQELRLEDVVADSETARPEEAAEQADIARILHERMNQLDLLPQFIVAMRSDIGDASALALRLMRDEAALSLARGRSIAAAAAKLDDLPARIRQIGSAEPIPVALPLPEEQEMVLAI